MPSGDLSKPLGQDMKEPIRASRLFMFGSLGAMALVFLGLVGWIMVTNNPDGGFPTREVDLSNSMNGSGGLVGVEGIRPTIKAGIPETSVPGQDEQSASLQPDGPQDQSGEGSFQVLDPSDPRLNASQMNPEDAPYQLYAKKVNSDAIAGLPKIAIIIDGLGLSQTTTQEALTLLPADVTLAFAPYGNSLARWTQKARSQGHELLVQVPMEPFDYPNNDPGPHTLLTTANAEVNHANLEWVLGRFEEYVGVINYMGARFATDELAATDFMTTLNSKGLLYVENGASGRSQLSIVAKQLNVPNLRSDLVIDFRGRPEDIETRLVQLESIAQENGMALGVASAFPTSIRAITDWTQSLRQRGFALIPVTVLLQQ